MHWARETTRFLAAGVLLVAAGLKVAELLQLGSSGALPRLTRPLVSLLVAAIEAVLGFGLLTPWWAVVAVPVFLWTVCLEGLATAFALAGVDAHTCGCFGSVQVPSLAHGFLVVGLCMLGWQLVSYASLAKERSCTILSSDGH